MDKNSFVVNKLGEEQLCRQQNLKRTTLSSTNLEREREKRDKDGEGERERENEREREQE